MSIAFSQRVRRLGFGVGVLGCGVGVWNGGFMSRLGRYIKISILSTESDRIESKSDQINFDMHFRYVKKKKKLVMGGIGSSNLLVNRLTP